MWKVHDGAHKLKISRVARAQVTARATVRPSVFCRRRSEHGGGNGVQEREGKIKAERVTTNLVLERDKTCS